jgi:hypothetical protein
MASKTKSSSGNVNGKKKAEPVFVIKPVTRLGGLDNLHISLIALVVILVALAFALSTFKPSTVLETCNGTVVNGTCAQQSNSNSTAALASVERYLASYYSVNSSLSLLSYYSMPNDAKVAYIPSTGMWLATVPYMDPLANDAIYNVSFLLYPNLSLDQAYGQTLKPFTVGTDRSVALGTVDIAGRALCTTKAPYPAYVFSDPYAPGTFQSLYTAINLSKDSRLNVSYMFIFTGYASKYYNAYGVQETQALGSNMFCASLQPGFMGYLDNLSKIYYGYPINGSILTQVAVGSGLNMTRFNSCMANSTTLLNRQAQLSKLYNVTATPVYVLDCKYATIPATSRYAVDYLVNATAR